MTQSSHLFRADVDNGQYQPLEVMIKRRYWRWIMEDDFGWEHNVNICKSSNIGYMGSLFGGKNTHYFGSAINPATFVQRYEKCEKWKYFDILLLMALALSLYYSRCQNFNIECNRDQLVWPNFFTEMFFRFWIRPYCESSLVKRLKKIDFK